jgi:hypothetical protein
MAIYTKTKSSSINADENGLCGPIINGIVVCLCSIYLRYHHLVAFARRHMVSSALQILSPKSYLHIINLIW